MTPVMIVDTLLFGVALFAATNMDGLLILGGLFADGRYSTPAIFLGQSLAMLALVAAGALASLARYQIPLSWLGLLGLVPVALGVARLLARGKVTTGAGPLECPAPSCRLSQIGSVAAFSIAGGGDNVTVYAPIFASRAGNQLAIILLAFVPMVALWCWLAKAVVRDSQIGWHLRLHGPRLLPLLMIGIGVMVLADTGLMRLLAHLIARATGAAFQ